MIGDVVGEINTIFAVVNIPCTRASMYVVFSMSRMQTVNVSSFPQVSLRDVMNTAPSS